MGWRAALLVAIFSAAIASAAPPPTFDAADARRIDGGETVVHERTTAGYAWPEIVVYRRSTASPTALMAIYADFDAQSSWVPDLVSSRAVSRDAPNVTRVFYEYETAGPNERYTLSVTVTRDGDGWRAGWALVSARYTRRLEGSVRVVPRGEGSLVIYTNLIDPGPLGVTFGTPATVGNRIARTAEALTKRTEHFVATEPARLAALVEALNGMVPSRPSSR
jgi:hypothetical protein